MINQRFICWFCCIYYLVFNVNIVYGRLFCLSFEHLLANKIQYYLYTLIGEFRTHSTQLQCKIIQTQIPEITECTTRKRLHVFTRMYFIPTQTIIHTIKNEKKEQIHNNISNNNNKNHGWNLTDEKYYCTC